MLYSPLLSFPTIDTGHLDVTSPEIKFTVTPSLEGGIDTEIGSAIIRVPKYFSVQHPVCQMVLLADQYGDKFYYPKRLAPQRIVHMFEKSHSSASQKVYEAGWVAAKPELQPHNNGGTGSEFGRAEICGGSNEPSLPVLRDSASEAQRSDDDGFVLDSGACERSNTNGDRQKDSTITMHGQPFLDNPGDEKHWENSQSSAAPLITPSAETTDVQMVHELGQSELEYHSDLVAEPVIVKTEEANASATWIVATAAPHHATGNHDLLSSFTTLQHSAELFVHAADGTPMQVLGCGNVVTDAVVLPDVWYIPVLTANLISVSQLAELDYGVGFSRAECYIRSPDDGARRHRSHGR
ncbi:uncharacterized protein [Miscanthus floridulus]|uniref:uncharacterized protein n=1 Tax=Miscanthus floridulus TaxID=154761 RepID=UPI0034584295